MKQKVLAFGLILLLSSCSPQGGIAPPSDTISKETSTVETTSIPPNAPSETYIKILETVASDRAFPTDGSFLSIVIGTWDIYINGDQVEIENQPYIEDDTIYLPAQELIEKMGGYFEFQPNDGTITIIYKPWSGFTQDSILQFQLGSKEASVWVREKDSDVWLYDTWKQSPYIGGHRDLDMYHGDGTPTLKNDVVYIPSGFLPGNPKWSPNQNAMIYEWYDRLDGISDMWTDMPFDDLSQSWKDELALIRSDVPYFPEDWLPEGSPFLCNTYGNSDIEIETIRWDPSVVSDKENMGVEYVLSIKLLSKKYQTTRGLRVGDPLARFELLYGATMDERVGWYIEDSLDHEHSERTNFKNGAIHYITFYWKAHQYMTLGH